MHVRREGASENVKIKWLNDLRKIALSFFSCQTWFKREVQIINGTSMRSDTDDGQYFKIKPLKCHSGYEHKEFSIMYPNTRSVRHKNDIINQIFCELGMKFDVLLSRTNLCLFLKHVIA